MRRQRCCASGRPGRCAPTRARCSAASSWCSGTTSGDSDDAMALPLLTLSWVVPLVGAIAVLLVGNTDGRRDGAIRWLALAVSLAAFAVTLGIWAGFDASSAEFQFVERVPWIPSFGIDYYLGIDGISLLLVVLTAFLTPIAL